MGNPVDLTRIQETSDGDMEFERELIEMYLEDARGHLEQLDKLVAQNDGNGIKVSAHTLKGSSSNVGALGLVDLSAQMEKMGLACDFSNAGQHVHHMWAAFREIEQYFNRYLEQIGG